MAFTVFQQNTRYSTSQYQYGSVVTTLIVVEMVARQWIGSAGISGDDCRLENTLAKHRAAFAEVASAEE